MDLVGKHAHTLGTGDAGECLELGAGVDRAGGVVRVAEQHDAPIVGILHTIDGSRDGVRVEATRQRKRSFHDGSARVRKYRRRTERKPAT